MDFVYRESFEAPPELLKAGDIIVVLRRIDPRNNW